MLRKSFKFGLYCRCPDSSHSLDQNWCQFVGSIVGPTLTNDVGSTSFCSSTQRSSWLDVGPMCLPQQAIHIPSICQTFALGQHGLMIINSHLI